MTTSATFKDVDHGAQALLKAVVKASLGSTLKVGILAKGEDAKKEASEGLTVADVATFHEFGLGVPQRSFIRGWYDDFLDRNKADFRALFRQVVYGKIDRATMWQRLGLKWVADIQRRIVAGIAPGLAASTIARKGSSTPLIDTGQLKSSVTFEVEA